MKRKAFVGLVAAIGLIFMAAPATAQPDPSQLLSKLVQVNQMMVKAGHLAADKASHDDVRDYGERLWRDHMTALNKLRAVAQEQNIPIGEYQPQSPEEKKQMRKMQQMMQKLQTSQQSEFDQLYVQFMLNAQKNIRQQLEKAAGMVKLEPLASLLRHLTPIVGQHIDLASYLQREVLGKTRG